MAWLIRHVAIKLLALLTAVLWMSSESGASEGGVSPPADDGECDYEYGGSRPCQVLTPLGLYMLLTKSKYGQRFVEKPRGQADGSELLIPPSRRSDVPGEPGCTSCDDRFSLLQLGADFYPRTLFQKLCKSQGCKPPSVCRPITYSIPVLKKSGSDGDTDPAPPTLGGGWKPGRVTVNVACVCSYPGF